MLTAEQCEKYKRAIRKLLDIPENNNSFHVTTSGLVRITDVKNKEEVADKLRKEPYVKDVYVNKDIYALLVDNALEESIEMHDSLNPKIWNDDQEIIPEVRAKILQIVDEFKRLLALDAVDLKVEDIYLLGSNANYNYNEDSDLDIHIIADESFDCSNEHLPIIYNAYKTLFNNKYNLSIKGINAEIYVENKDKLSNVSSGVYSFKDGWIKKPTKYEIPEVDQTEVDKKVQLWEDKYYNVIENPTVKKIDDYIDAIYDLRIESIQKDGEFGVGNLVFKEIRRLGYLEELKNLKTQLVSKELSLESLSEAKEENLESKLREILASKEDHLNGKPYLFETNKHDDYWVEHFDEEAVDFNTLKVYERTPEEKSDGEYIATFMISGGKNGNGDWVDYLRAIANTFKEIKEKTDAIPLLYKLDTDISDDVWTGYVFLYDHEDKGQESLNEDLIVIEPEEGKEKIEELRAQIENCDDPKLRRSLLTLMNVYLFQTYRPSDRENSTLTDDEWQETADWHKEKSKEIKKESLTEGCWKMPYTLAEVNKLKELMSKPVDAFEVGDHFDNKNDQLGIGDDSLYDDISRFRKEKGCGSKASGDVRRVIQKFIKEKVLPDWDNYSYSQPEGDSEGHTWEAGVKEIFQEIADMDISDKADEIRKNAEEHDAGDFSPEEVKDPSLDEGVIFPESLIRIMKDYDIEGDYIGHKRFGDTFRLSVNARDKKYWEVWDALKKLNPSHMDSDKDWIEISLDKESILEDSKSMKHKFSYNGPLYIDGQKFVDNWQDSTSAVSPKQALNILNYKARQYLELTHGVELVPEHLHRIVIDVSKVQPVDDRSLDVCKKCGRHLTTSGTCPQCDDSAGTSEIDESK